MRRITNIVLAFVALTFLVAASASGDGWFTSRFNGEKGSGDLVTETRDVKEFTRIETTGSADITVTVGGEQSIEITFDDNLIDYIETKVRGKTLKIGSTESYSSRNSCVIVITVPELERVICSGSGDIMVERLDAANFEFKLSGSGRFTAEGKAEELEIQLSGSGDIDAGDLVAKDAYVILSGSGNVKVHAVESLEAKLSGSGNINYYGDPESVSRSVTGSGRIRSK